MSETNDGSEKTKVIKLYSKDRVSLLALFVLQSSFLPVTSDPATLLRLPDPPSNLWFVRVTPAAPTPNPPAPAPGTWGTLRCSEGPGCEGEAQGQPAQGPLLKKGGPGFLRSRDWKNFTAS